MACDDVESARTELSGSSSSDHLPTVLGPPAGSPGPLLSIPSGPDRYEIGEILGRGGMGEVYRAHDRAVRRDVAVKRLRPDRKSRDIVRRLLEEGQITGQLEHPGIVPVHDIGIDARGDLFLVMKIVEGRSLKATLEEARDGLRLGNGESAFPLARRLAVFETILETIRFSHTRGVLHRDLKPSNIMLGDFGEILVMDWGLARLVDAGEEPIDSQIVSDRSDEGVDRTCLGRMVGTVGYMPPEQMRGEIDRLDERTDIYALGAILYEILTLARAHEGEDTRSLTLAVLEKELERPSVRVSRVFEDPRARPIVPEELEAMALVALSRAPDERYPSVAEFQEDLRAFLRDESVSVHADPLARRFVKWTRRHPRRAIFLASTGFFAILLGLVLAVTLGQLERMAREKAQEAVALAREEHRNEVLQRELVESERDRLLARQEAAETSRDLMAQTTSKSRLVERFTGRTRPGEAIRFEEIFRESQAEGQTSAEFLTALTERDRRLYRETFEEMSRVVLTEGPGSGYERQDTFFLAILLAHDGETDRALALLKQVIREEPVYWEARMELGLLLFLTGEPEKGRAALERAHEDCPLTAFREKIEGLLETGLTPR